MLPVPCLALACPVGRGVAVAATVGVAAPADVAGAVAAASPEWPCFPVCVVSAACFAFPVPPSAPLTVQAISASTPMAAASAITLRRQ